MTDRNDDFDPPPFFNPDELPPLPAFGPGSESGDGPDDADMPLPSWFQGVPIPVGTAMGTALEPFPELHLPEMGADIVREPEPEPEIAVHVSEAAPKENLTRPIAYGLLAKVTLPRSAHQFRVEHDLPAGIQLLDTVPPARIDGRRLIWDLGRVDPGAEIRLQVVAFPDETFAPNANELTQFRATYQQNLNFQTPVLRPKLSLTVEAPDRIEAGQPVPLTVVVDNRGNWAVDDIALTVTLPDGLQLANSGPIRVPIGTLEPEESRTVTIPVRSTKPGVGTIQAKAQGGSCEAVAERAIRILAPEIAVAIEPQGTWYSERDCELSVRLHNRGTATARDVQFSAQLHGAFEILRGDGFADAESRMMLWFLPELAAGEQKTFTLVAASPVPLDGRVDIHLKGDNVAETQVSHPLCVDFDPLRSGNLLEDFLAGIGNAPGQNGPNTAGTSTAPRLRKAVEAGTQHVLFRIGATEYAFPLARILEVGRPGLITPLPGVPDWLLGISNIRGDIVSVVDLRRSFGLEPVPADRNTRMLVLGDRSQTTTIAAIVDRVIGIRNVDETTVVEPTAPLDDVVAESMTGIVECDGRMVVLLDVERILASARLQSFESV
jgi:chemotaxis signal transduction protein